MRALVWVLAFGSACGRYGFADGRDASASDGAGDAAAASKPDSAAPLDAIGLVIDSPPGVGDYTVAQSTAAYVALAGQPVPGFAVGDDDQNYVLALPFTFVFYGISYGAVTISVNGYVTFGTPVTGTETTQNDCPLDTTPPDAVIAVFWDDLLATPTAPTGSITYLVDGSVPDRRLTIEWRDMDAFYPVGMNAFTQGVRVTHQLVLHESGTIEMRYGPRSPPQYPNKDCGPDRHRGCSATVGLEAPGSTMFKNVQCGTSAGPGPGYVPIDEGRLITYQPI